VVRRASDHSPRANVSEQILEKSPPLRLKLAPPTILRRGLAKGLFPSDGDTPFRTGLTPNSCDKN